MWNGAWRGHSGATSYWRRKITSERAASVDGFPWLTAGSWRARMYITAMKVIPRSARMMAEVSTLPIDTPSLRPSTRRLPTGSAKYPSWVVKARRIALGSASSGMRWSDHARPAMYPRSRIHRASDLIPARSPAQRIQHPKRKVTAYTSASVALSHTVDINPAVTPAAVPPRPSSVQRAKRLASIPHAAAVHAADRRLIDRANPKTGAKTMLQTLPSITYSGVPGGCGIPSEWMAARNSPESQSVTLGARVSMYTNRSRTAVVQPGVGNRLVVLMLEHLRFFRR